LARRTTWNPPSYFAGTQRSIPCVFSSASEHSSVRPRRHRTCSAIARRWLCAGALQAQALRALNHSRQRVDVDGFDQMLFEAGLARALAIGFLAVAGHGHESELRRQPLDLAQAPRELVAVHDR